MTSHQCELEDFSAPEHSTSKASLQFSLLSYISKASLSTTNTERGVVWLMRLVLLVDMAGLGVKLPELWVGLIRFNFSFVVVLENSSILEAICCKLASNLTMLMPSKYKSVRLYLTTNF